MMALPEALKFTVGLIDQISKPIAEIQKNISGMVASYREGTESMVAGAAGLIGAGFAIQSALQPAIDLDAALADLKAINVTDEALKAVTKTAFDFSNQFGKSAVDVISAANGIRNVMGDMPAHVLASVTKSSAMLAMSMKSDTETTTRYLKTLYGNYKAQADSMGVDAWTANVASMTAKARQLYGMNMDSLEGGIEGMHSLTSTLGVSMQEQLAVFGMLMKQMSDGDATTQFTNFLEGAVEAQEKLGVKLTDTHGNLLPMIDILQVIKPLIADLSGADARFKLDEAGLGDGSLMLINLIDRMDEFKAGINELNSVTGLDVVTKMATAMTSQWERLSQGIFNVRAAFGAVLMPALVPVVSGLADGASEIVRWTQLFPNIARWIGYITLGLLSFTAANGIFVLAVGIAKQAMASYGLVMGAWGAITSGLSAVLTWFKGAMLAVNIVIAANPIILIVGACAAAGLAIAALIYRWDDLKASFGETAWFQSIAVITVPFRAAFEAIKGMWLLVTSGFSDITAFDGLFAIIDEIRNVFGNLFGWISDKFMAIFDWFKGKFDWMPGLDFNEEGKAASNAKQKQIPNLTSEFAPALDVYSLRTATSHISHLDKIQTNEPALALNLAPKVDAVDAVAQTQPALNVSQGGITQRMANYNQTKSTNYGGVNIYTTQMSSPLDLATELEMSAP